MNLKVDLIRTDGGTQPRAQMDLYVACEYAVAMQEGTEFPPLTVFYDGTDYWLADGFHRLEAAKKCGYLEIPADVRQGARRDAILYSVSANATHGLRRKNDDKKRAVDTLLQDEEWRAWSDNEIARRTATSPPFVADRRQHFARANPHLQTFIDANTRKAERNGKTYTLATAGIGPKKPAPSVSSFIPDREPEAPADENPLLQVTETLLRVAAPELMDALDRGDTERIEELQAAHRGSTSGVLQLQEPTKATNGHAPAAPSRSNGQPVIDARVDDLSLHLEKLASVPLSGREFRERALPYTLRKACEHARRVRVLLDEIEGVEAPDDQVRQDEPD